MILPVAIVGGGPAGLMAADVISASGVAVDLYEGKGSVGRKFLLAGKGGLNLTHSEALNSFVARYGKESNHVARWLSAFGPAEIRSWSASLGVDTFVGSSGRVFPIDMKSAPLLRAWVRRLRSQGVSFHVNHRCLGVAGDRRLLFETVEGEQHVNADAVVLALGGASWPQLGSDGKWVEWFEAQEIVPLQSANCGFDVSWSKHFAEKFAGQPVKTVTVSVLDAEGRAQRAKGEFVVTASGVEGSLIYAFSSTIRESISISGRAEVSLDLLPDLDETELQRKLSQARNARTLTEHLRRTVGLSGVKLGLLYEICPKEVLADTQATAKAIKHLTLTAIRPRPIEEVISTAGGVRFSALNESLMLNTKPGVFCAGEMLDWEAPTGGYLLTACLASGRVAGQSALEWLTLQRASASKPALP